ncbi:hypothetical protein ACNOYE_35930 [Nannocystaceae bacterium ST9]
MKIGKPEHLHPRRRTKSRATTGVQCTLQVAIFVVTACWRSPAEVSPADELSAHKPTPGTAHRLLRMEAELLHECNGRDGNEWYASMSKPLDDVVAHARSRIRKLNVQDWSKASSEQVVTAFREIDIGLHESGFAVCVFVQLLSESLGEPVLPDDERTRRLPVGDKSCIILSEPDYRERYLRKHRCSGLRPIDCDLSSFVYMTIAEAEEWPLSFVEVPGHNFVRWRFADGSHLNWDTNDAQQYTDDEYRRGDAGTAGPFDEATERAGGYLRDMTQGQIDGYYISLFIDRIDTPGCLKSAYDQVGEHNGMPPVVYNHFAWAFATKVEFQGTRHASQAPKLGELATAADPDCAFWDTLSCAYAANGDFDKAAEVERLHVSSDSPRIPAYEAGRTCYEPAVAENGGCPPK